MSVVRRDARRRWMLVGAGVVVLSLVPVLMAARSMPQRQVDVMQLRELVLASAGKPYQGYVDSRASLGVPDLPELSDVAGLVGGTARLRAWYAAPSSWRVAVLEPTGERDIYRTAEATYVWDFARNLVTETVGDLPVRLPWAADLLPPDLARRLLVAAGDDPVTSIPSRLVAGVTAAGMRLVPSDPQTTVGRVDVWADPATGLPVQVEVAARGGLQAAISTRFLEVSQVPPDAQVLAAPRPQDAGFTTTTAPEVLSAIGTAAVAVPLPGTLASRAQVASSNVGGVAAYGTGLTTFVVAALPGRYGGRTIGAVQNAGAVQVQLSGGQGYETGTQLLSLLVIRTDGDRRTRRTYLLAGPVTPAVLRQAGADLLAAPR